jgi:ABC-2 type transport system permease protein
MTTHTTALEQIGPPASPDAGASFPAATGQTARRTLLQYVRTPQLLVMAPLTAGLFLLIFRYIFGGAIDAGGGVSYVDFLIPGFLAQTPLWNAMNIPAGVAEDSTSGVYDRLRSLPIPRAAVMAGRAFADTAFNIWAMAVVTLLGFLVGFSTNADLAAVVGAFGLILVMIYAFTWAFISLGLFAANAQAAQALSTLVVIPLTFVSAAFVPVDSMPSAIQWFAASQPVTVIVNAVRSLMLGGTDAAGVGHSTGYWVLLSLLWCAGVLAVSAWVAVTRFSRRR